MLTAFILLEIIAIFLPKTPSVRKAVPICMAATHDCVSPQSAASPGPPRKELALVYVATRVMARTSPPMERPPIK